MHRPYIAWAVALTMIALAVLCIDAQGAVIVPPEVGVGEVTSIEGGTADTEEGGTAGTEEGGTADTGEGGTADTGEGGTAGTGEGGTAGTDEGGTAGTEEDGTAGTEEGGTAGTEEGGTADTEEDGTAGTGRGTATDAVEDKGGFDGTDEEEVTAAPIGSVESIDYHLRLLVAMASLGIAVAFIWFFILKPIKYFFDF